MHPCVRLKWMSSHVHFKIELQLFIYQRVLEKKKKEYNSIEPPAAVVQHLAFFFYYYTSNCNDVMADRKRTEDDG